MSFNVGDRVVCVNPDYEVLYKLEGVILKDPKNDTSIKVRFNNFTEYIDNYDGRGGLDYHYIPRKDVIRLQDTSNEAIW